MVVSASLVGLVAAAAGLAATGTVALRERGRPGVLAFAGACWALAAAALVVGLAGGVAGPGSVGWLATTALFLVFVTAFAWFVARYTGEVGLATERPLSTLAPVPALGVVTLVVFHVSGRQLPRNPGSADPVGLVFVTLPLVLVGAVFFGSLLLLVLAGLRYASTQPRRTGALVLGALGPGLFHLTIALVPTVDAGLGPAAAVGYGVAAVGFGLAVVRFDLLESTPLLEAIGRDALVGEIEDLVILADRNGRIADCNRAAVAALDVDRSEAVGESVAAHLDVPADLGGVDTIDSIEIDAREGRHVYEASVSPIGRGDRVLGYAMVCRDVTERRTRRQRLEVLNRVLRHNLRNDMTTVLGYADLLADETDDTDAVERIRQTADELSRLGDKASEIERLVAASREPGGETDAARLCQYVAEEARKQYPDATVDVELGEAATIAADERVCWTVVWNLVENAIEHSDRPEPLVELRYVRTAVPDPRVRIVVADDGPGIPDTERRAIAAGTEGPLSHGSGLGLWAVKWGANRVGGDVAIQEREPRGTAVVVTLPAARTAEASSAEDLPT